MGSSDRRKFINYMWKMDPITWLSLVIAVVTLSTPALSSEPRVVCYYTNWSVYRPGTARFNPQNINPYLCTHLVYAFGGFTKDNTLKPFDKYQDIEKGGYAKFTGLKTYNKNLKTLLAIGGWNEGSSRFSPMVASKEKRKEFVRNVIKFLRQNRFDGLDLDWEYPAFRDGGKPKDRENYAKLVRELREEFDRESEKTGKPRLLLTMAVPAGIEYIQKGFDVKTLNQYLDWMNLLTYDYHSAFEPAVNHHAPLYPLEEPNEYSVDNELNIDYTIKFYLENGADRDKLVLGIPTYGRSYTLFNKDAVEIGSPADGPGEQGDATREKGYLAYYEICESLKPKKKKRSTSDDDSEEDSSEEAEDEPWTVVQPNPNAMGPFAYKGNQWVGYDDVDIVKKKAEYVAENGLGGIMFWSIDNDDFRGTCHGKPYPLIEAAKEAYIVKLGSTDNAIVTDRPRAVSTVRSSSNRRRNRPRSSTTTTTERPTTRASNKRKSGSTITSTTPSWNIITPEPPTTPDPGSDFKCTDEGFFPHPRDCKKYFWCLDSGPSNLGIVAHQFTCPSGLFFNKAADSCDFARNVLCKKAASTTKAPTTKAVTTTTSTTTRKPVKLSTKSSALFRTTTSTTTTPEPEVDEEYEDEPEDPTEIDAEDPKVIKELIDLIKKVGGVEQLEKQLHLSEAGSTDGAITTTPAAIAINKRLYQKVLERTRGKSNKINGNSALENGGNSISSLYSRRGPQNAGLEATADKDKLLKKDRPQYTTINRSRPSTSTQQPEEEEEDDDDLDDIPVSAPRQPQSRVVEEARVGTTAKPLQYVNIRRARPLVTSDTADDSASRNALFERAETYVTVTEPNTLDIASARRENIPEYVTIRRQRPTTEEATTEQYQNTDPEEPQETALEKEISSPQPSSTQQSSQPQYTSIVRVRSTTTTPAPEESSPEPTTVLAVQISSLLNSPSSEVENSEEDTKTTIAEATETIPTTTSTTITRTTQPPSSASTRRTILRRRGSTTTTQATPSSSTQVSSRNYSFVRRRRPLPQPNEITSDSTEDNELSRKIRSTTPDSRETDAPRTESVQPRRSRVRFQQTQQVEDSVPAAASQVPRGRFRPELSRDELLSLTPIDVEISNPQFVPRTFTPRNERRFRGSTTVPDRTEDSEVSAATVELRRPNIVPRGRSRFTPSSTTPALELSEATESTPSPRRPTFTRFSPRPFSRTSSTAEPEEEEAETVVTQRLPIRLPFGRSRVSISTSTASPPSTASPIQARRNLFSARQPSTPRTTTPESEEEEIDQNKDDISLSESTVAEQEHDDAIDANDELPKRRIVIKKLRASVSSTTESIISTEAVQISEDGKKRFRVIRRRPASSTQATEETITESNETSSPAPQRIRKIIRKKIRPVEDEPEIIAKSIGSINSAKDTTTEIIANYGEKSKILQSTAITPTEAPAEESEKEINETEVTKQEIPETSEQPKNENPEQESDEKPKETDSSDVKKDESSPDNDTYTKPEVTVETEQKAIDLSEQKDENSSEELQEEIEETSPTTPSTTTTTPQPSSTSTATTRGRLPYRPPKRVFTTATESSVPSSSRTFSRKFNPGVYTSPATPGEKATQATTRRPFSFTRRPFTRTTKKVIEEEEELYSEEEELDEPEEENSFILVPPNQLFSKRPKPTSETEESGQISEEEDEEEVEEQPQRFIPRRPPTFRPKTVNSNTFRTTSSTTELPKRPSQNRTAIYNKFSGKAVNETKKRVQNVPPGYISPSSTKPEVKETVQESNNKSAEDVTTTTSITEETETATDDDDYLTMTEATGTTDTESTSSDDVTSTNTIDGETTTSGVGIDDSSDDYLESTDGTTNLPTTQDFSIQTEAEKETTSDERITAVITEASQSYDETTTESSPETTTLTMTTTTTSTTTTAAPVVKTQYDKLFSVSRVVEVNSKLDKHRLNKKNETTLIEEGQIMVEKKPTVDKIGEVSRFSLIKIYEDEIPIYLTKLGHVYPVENPPDHHIRIDETRNARALVNFADAPKENLIASESMNEAYRHINKVISQPKHESSIKEEVEHVNNDDFLRYVNDDKKSSKSEEDLSYTQWQFIPAAYENEQNKGAKKFEIVTPRGMLTEPSTLPLEALFKTEIPVARKVDDKGGKQPFVVYSASLPSQKEEANIVKLQVLKPETGRSIITFAKGQEFLGGPVTEEATVKYPVNISILSETSPTPSSTTISTTTETATSPIIEMLTTIPPTTTTPEPSTIALTTEAPTTETTVEETTTIKSPLDTKRSKFAFPRRPAFKSANVTRPTIVPRPAKKNNTLNGNLFQKPNKTTTFNNKSRYTGNRAQNVPVDIRKKTTKAPLKSFTTEVPRTTTERRLYVKPIRPNLRPAFVPRRNTTPSTQTTGNTVQTPKRSFLRRTKATAAPDFDNPDENTSSKYKRTNFKSRTSTETPVLSSKSPEGATNASEVAKKEENGGKRPRRPSLNSSGARNERPTRNFVRRRLGGANATTSSTTPSSTTPSSTTPAPSSPVVSRRPFRVAARRRLSTTSTTTTTTTSTTTETPTTAMIASEEYLQDIGDTDFIEDPTPEDRPTPNLTKTRRPLLLKDEPDQNPSATNEEESKRHSKKYSASFKQNQLDEVLKKREKAKSSQEVFEGTTTEGMLRTTAEDNDAETALAIAAHQLLSAPLPSIPNYDEEPKQTKKPSRLPTTIHEYEYTSPTYTDDYTTRNTYDYSSTPIYKIGNQDFIQTTTGTIYDITTSFNSARTNPNYTPKTTTYPSSPFTSRVSRPAAFTTANILTTLSKDPTTEFSRIQNPTANPGFARNTETRGFTRASTSTLSSGFNNIPTNHGASTARYVGTTDKLIPVPVEDYGFTTGGYSSISQEPSYFTREYLLESPVTKTYDDEYQYLSPTTPQTTTRKIPKKITHKRISTTIAPTIQSYEPAVTAATPRRVSNPKPFEKIPLNNKQHLDARPKYKSVENYDYYDDGAEHLASKYDEGTKVVLHSKGVIECLDIGNFPHPSSCKKFISCARLENGSLLGWEYICPKGLSFDPVGGICNWSAGLGCNEKDI